MFERLVVAGGRPSFNSQQPSISFLTFPLALLTQATAVFPDSGNIVRMAPILAVVNQMIGPILDRF